MSNPALKTSPPDQAERERTLDPANSILVQAPAGSGKTDLLTRRFLRLLTEVEDPGQIVAITFTKAAAAEMRHRILSKLEDAAARIDTDPNPDPFSMESLARRALQHSQALGWNLLDQPAQLRISTIDSFCREIALQQPLLSGLGDGLGIYEQPDELYRRAARQALNQIDAQIDGADGADTALRTAIESLLLWRDNNWSEVEDQLVEMLRSRDRWMHDFVLEREQDWDALRKNLERPFAKAIEQSLVELSIFLDQVPNSRDEALALARFACEEPGEKSPWALAECVEIPSTHFTAQPESALSAYVALGAFLQTQKGTWRSEKGLKTSDGFPSTPRGKSGKTQFAAFISRLSAIPGLEAALASVRSLPPARYTDEDWQIVRACFTLLRNAAAQLKVVFAEAGAVDYIEVAQIALNVLKAPDDLPTDAALALADGIRHILVDEFQDTSRRQHELLRRLIAAWPEREGRSCFVVGDPMQSIYFFRDADAELFPRVKTAGLEIPGADPLLFDPVALTSNFRTARPLVTGLNEIFTQVFVENDGSGVTFSPAIPARNDSSASTTVPPQSPRAPSIRLLSGERVGQHEVNLASQTLSASQSNFELHINFLQQLTRVQSTSPDTIHGQNTPSASHIAEIVALMCSHSDRMEQARANGDSYRIAVLGRTRNALAPIAQALRAAAIPFRAVDLEKLSARPEVLDALALARALLNPLDRVAWLGTLRAPWCGLSLADLHTLTSADSAELIARPISELLTERVSLLTEEGRQATERVAEVLSTASTVRFAQPTASLGTWLEQVWLRLGGAQCVDPTAHANLNLLWQCLDSLPNGEQDLLGPALPVALEKLTAQPDPEAGSDCGIQLMTIHKSKGLEFEVVIVPELQAASRKGKPKMLSWLERGLPPEDTAYDHDGSAEVTEFLVAPLQSKGFDRGSTKLWVDRVYRDREKQETRRILYVAATRARDELHLFAQPACKQDKNGDWTLAEPKDSLLATAWPALHSEIEQQFEAWKQTIAEDQAEPAVLESLAASAASNLLVMPAPIKPTQLRRLPPNYRLAQSNSDPSNSAEMLSAPSLRLLSGERVGDEELPVNLGDSLYARHQGGLVSRALGTAVHSLLENLATLRKSSDRGSARAALKQFQPRVAAQIRAAGLDASKAKALAAEALRLALDASSDPTGNWILSPHSEDASEARWTSLVSGALRTVQVDRVFRAGLQPLSEGTEAWWIVDYKTAHADNLASAEALPQLRAIFAPQLEAYAQVLRKLHGTDTPVRAGLYYPRMLLFDWWQL
jgi:ATP-dependent helicase/nuclease subunit A